jgi:hypothetical protein
MKSTNIDPPMNNDDSTILSMSVCLFLRPQNHLGFCLHIVFDVFMCLLVANTVTLLNIQIHVVCLHHMRQSFHI